MADMLTPETFKAALPPQMRATVSQELLDGINRIITDPEEREIFKENLLTYSNVLKQGKFRLDQYLNAVRFVSFKVMGFNNREAYIRTFSAKYQRFLQQGVSEKDIASYYTAYNKSKLVVLVYEQSLIPTHILNAPLFQEAINTAADLMRNARSEKVRCEAASALMRELKPPEVKKIELDVAHKEDSSIKALRETSLQLVEQQKLLLAAGASALDIAQSKLIIEPEFEVSDGC